MTDWMSTIDPDTIMAAFTGIFLIIVIAIFVIMLFVETLFLKFGINKVEGNKTEFGPVFLTVILMALVSMVPCAGIFLAWWVISARHEVSYGKAILAWLIALLLAVLVEIVLFAIIFFAGLIPTELLDMSTMFI
ncbi:hypothetical protein [Candidatus Harpocratesius sp.]